MRRCDPGEAAADDNDALALWAVRLDDGGGLVRPGLGQHCTHGSPRSCSLSLTVSASFCRKRCSQRSSHSGLLEPRGTSTVLKEPGVRDRTFSVIPRYVPSGVSAVNRSGAMSACSSEDPAV